MLNLRPLEKEKDLNYKNKAGNSPTLLHNKDGVLLSDVRSATEDSTEMGERSKISAQNRELAKKGNKKYFKTLEQIILSSPRQNEKA